jgi:hypothetical protein
VAGPGKNPDCSLLISATLTRNLVTLTPTLSLEGRGSRTAGASCGAPPILGAQPGDFECAMFVDRMDCEPEFIMARLAKRTFKAAGTPASAHAVKSNGSISKSPKRRARRSGKTIHPLPFYSQVEAIKGHSVPVKIAGRKGIVLGRAKTEEGGWNYAVFFRGVSYCLPHVTLKPTGIVFERSEIYSGKSMKVLVDDSGHGTPVTATSQKAHG